VREGAERSRGRPRASLLLEGPQRKAGRDERGGLMALMGLLNEEARADPLSQPWGGRLPQIPQFSDTPINVDPNADFQPAVYDVNTGKFGPGSVNAGWQQALTALMKDPALYGNDQNAQNGPAMYERTMQLFNNPQFAQQWNAIYPGTLPGVSQILGNHINLDRNNKGGGGFFTDIAPMIAAIGGGALAGAVGGGAAADTGT